MKAAFSIPSKRMASSGQACVERPIVNHLSPFGKHRGRKSGRYSLLLMEQKRTVRVKGRGLRGVRPLHCPLYPCFDVPITPSYHNSLSANRDEGTYRALVRVNTSSGSSHNPNLPSLSILSPQQQHHHSFELHIQRHPYPLAFPCQLKPSRCRPLALLITMKYVTCPLLYLEIAVLLYFSAASPIFR